MAQKIIRFWHLIGPFWHVIMGSITMMFLAGLYWGKVSAYDGRLTTLEMSQQTDTIALAKMQQEVHDIHEWVVPKRPGMP
jgi:hypothetical protein